MCKRETERGLWDRREGAKDCKKEVDGIEMRRV